MGRAPPAGRDRRSGAVAPRQRRVAGQGSGVGVTPARAPAGEVVPEVVAGVPPEHLRRLVQNKHREADDVSWPATVNHGRLHHIAVERATLQLYEHVLTGHDPWWPRLD